MAFNIFWELIIMGVLMVMGSAVYGLATRNRGSFADTPDWSKVIRRIIEFASVLLAVLLIAFLGWDWAGSCRVLFVLAPIAGVVMGVCSLWLLRKEKQRAGSKDRQPEEEGGSAKTGAAGLHNRLSEHLINAIILTLFFLSALLVIMITVARGCDHEPVLRYCTVLLVIFLSLELAALLYHIFRLICIDNLPNEEIAQILRIFKELDE